MQLHTVYTSMGHSPCRGYRSTSANGSGDDSAIRQHGKRLISLLKPTYTPLGLLSPVGLVGPKVLQLFNLLVSFLLENLTCRSQALELSINLLYCSAGHRRKYIIQVHELDWVREAEPTVSRYFTRMSIECKSL